MPASSAITYTYDGTFEGFLCCVFESYTAHEIPAAIYGPQEQEGVLFQGRRIVTCQQRAERVRKSIPERMGREVLLFLKQVFLTDLEHKESLMLEFLRMGYRYGTRIMGMRTHQRTYPLFQAVRRLQKEGHLWKGFLRFKEQKGILVAKFRPKCHVLPLIADHFCTRYPQERFLILDETHHVALMYRPREAKLVAIEKACLVMQETDDSETEELWRLFYETIEIRERRNDRCRMAQMPKWYWENMTEFCTSSAKAKR